MASAPPPADPNAGAAPLAPALRALDLFLGVSVLSLAVLLGSFVARNADLWGNLAIGRLVSTGQYPFGTDPFSALDPAPQWVNPAWLFGLLLYTLHQAAGGPALVAAKAVLVAAIAAVLMLIRRPGRGVWLSGVATVVALLAISPRLLLQPPVVTFLMLAVLLLVLNRPVRRQAWRLPVTVGVLVMLWANLDSGFVYGLGLLALWTVGTALQAVVPLGGSADPAEGPGPKDLAIALVVAVAACVINPYHVGVFKVSAELVPWTLPTELHSDRYFEQYFRAPWSKAYVTQVGLAPAWAYYLLVGLGLGSFLANVGGWRWARALAWLAFAALSTVSVRLVPHFAVVGCAILVLNLQAATAGYGASGAGGRAAFTRAYLAGAGRFLTALVVLGLCALAWPGWLAADADTPQPTRRVAWRIEADPTMVRVAEKLSGWYASGGLKAGEERGFHLFPEFALVCAWHCPQEKGLIDTRLAAPPDVAVDYAAMRRAVADLGTRDQRPDGDTAPSRLPELFRKRGVTHVVLTGQTPGSLVARALWRDADQFPAWAITGRGAIFGWRDTASPGPDVRAGLRINAGAEAFGAAATPLPPQRMVAAYRPPTAWERYASGLDPVPPDATESGLWLTYRDAMTDRAAIAAQLWQAIAAIGRAADPWTEILDLSPIGQSLPQYAREIALRRLLEARSLDGSIVLAVRAARRAILANPDDYEGYLRLGQAYGTLATDRELGWVQQRAALAQAVARIPPGGRGTAGDEFTAHAQLQGLYLAPPMQDELTRRQRPPFLDLALDSIERTVALLPRIAADTGLSQQQAEAQFKAMTERRDALRQDVKRRSDEYVTATARSPVPVRVAQAYGRGLVKEALDVLRTADAKDIGPDLVGLWVELELLAGDVTTARDLLTSPDRPPQLQPALRHVAIRAAAAVGDYDWADGELTTVEETLTKAAADASRMQVATFLQSIVPLPVTTVFPIAGATNRLLWLDAAQTRPEQYHLTQFHLWHGLIKLEEGRPASAAPHFRQARLYELARGYLRYLN